MKIPATLPAGLAFAALALCTIDAARQYMPVPIDASPKRDVFGQIMQPEQDAFVPVIILDMPAKEAGVTIHDGKPMPPGSDAYCGEWTPVNDDQSARVAHSEMTGIILTLEKKPGHLPRLILKVEDPKLDYAHVASWAKIVVCATQVRNKEGGPVLCWMQAVSNDGTIVYSGSVEVYGVIKPETKTKSKPKPKQVPKPNKDRGHEPDGITAIV